MKNYRYQKSIVHYTLYSIIVPFKTEMSWFAMCQFTILNGQTESSHFFPLNFMNNAHQFFIAQKQRNMKKFEVTEIFLRNYDIFEMH